MSEPTNARKQPIIAVISGSVVGGARRQSPPAAAAIAVASAEKILQREIDSKQHEDILGKLASEL